MTGRIFPRPIRPAANNNNLGKRRRDSDSDEQENKRARVDLNSSFKSSPSSVESKYQPEPTGRGEATSSRGYIETRAQRRARESQGSGRETPLVHPKPDKFPRRFMVDTADLQAKYPIEDEVYEIRDYLIKYDDFNIRTPTYNTQLRRANGDILPAHIKDLVQLKGDRADDHACMYCSRWFDGSKECTEETCYAPMRDELAEWAEDNITVHKTPGSRQGYGAYLRPGCSIEKGGYLGIYYGVTVEKGGEHVLESAYIFSMNGHEGEYHIDVDSAMYGNWTRFANSHCNPNTEVLPEQIGGIRVLAFKALRDINENEAVTINYGRAYFNGSIPPLLCTCDDKPSPHPNQGHKDDIASDSLVSKAATKSTIAGRRPSRLPHFMQLRATKNAAAGPTSIIRRPRRRARQAPRSASYISAVHAAIDNQEVIEVLGSDSGSDSGSSIASLNSVPNSSDEEMGGTQGIDPFDGEFDQMDLDE